MKNSFSSAVNESLNGRTQKQHESVINSEELIQKSAREKKELPPVKAEQAAPEDTLRADGQPRKSKAGRKRKSIAEKKVQMTLTISRASFESLNEWADSKPRSAPNYISEYVEEHLDDIIKYYSK